MPVEVRGGPDPCPGRAAPGAGRAALRPACSARLRAGCVCARVSCVPMGFGGWVGWFGAGEVLSVPGAPPSPGLAGVGWLCRALRS